MEILCFENQSLNTYFKGLGYDMKNLWKKQIPQLHTFKHGGY